MNRQPEWPGLHGGADGVSPGGTVGNLRIPREAVLEFSHCSGDRNPLHTSDAYARRTPTAGIVVHGVLAVLAALALAGKAGLEITRLKVEFQGPVMPDLDYSVVSPPTPNTDTLWICDGRRILVTIEITHGDRIAILPTEPQAESGPHFPRREPYHGLEGEGPITEQAGKYWPGLERLKGLLASFTPDTLAWSEWLVVALCCSTYVVGMEAPGRQALLRALCIDRGPDAWMGGRVSYVFGPISAAAFRRGIARVHIEGSRGTHRLFSATASAFVRGESEQRIGVVREANAPRDQVLDGRTAVVTGGSRGFGLALSAALLSYGCRVISIQRSPIEPWAAESLGDTFVAHQADAANVEQLSSLSDQLAADGQSLDFLFINATGPLGSLWLDRAHRQRVLDYATREIDMVLTPLACLLPNLEQSAGTCVYVSSEGLTDVGAETRTPMWRELPHYLAVKAAGESLVLSASAQYPRVKVDVWRLPPMDTTLAFRTSGESRNPPLAVADEALRGLIERAMPTVLRE